LDNDQKNALLAEILGSLFTSFSKFLPLNIVFEDKLVIAFKHPKPAYKNHILIVPKMRIKDLKELSKHKEYILAVFEALDKVTNGPEYTKGFKFVSNFGSYQKVKQVHFHVYSHSIKIQCSLCRDGGIGRHARLTCPT